MKKNEMAAGMLREYGRVGRGLKAIREQMSREEMLLLELIYIVPKKGNLDVLCQELEIEKSSVYRRRDKALARFAALWAAWEAGNWVGIQDED